MSSKIVTYTDLDQDLAAIVPILLSNGLAEI